MTRAVKKSERLNAGSARCESPSMVRKLNRIPSTSTVSPRPDAGNQPSSTANSKISISPTQKLGKLKPRIEPPMITFPLRDSGLNPAHMPSGMPTKMVIVIAETASSKVAGMRSMITTSAETPYLNEVPRSP